MERLVILNMLNRSKIQDCDLPQARGGWEVGGPAEAVVEVHKGKHGGGDDEGGEEVCAAVHVIGVYANVFMSFLLDLRKQVTYVNKWPLHHNEAKSDQ